MKTDNTTETTENELTDEEANEKILTFIVNEIKSGTTDAEIIKKFEDMGISTLTEDLITNVRKNAELVAAEEKPTPKSIYLAILGGTLAALTAGFLWAFITEATGYEYGIVAMVVGGMTGYGVLLFVRGKKGVSLQIIAVVTAVLGIAIGKYLIFFNSLEEILVSDYGLLANEISMYSGAVLELFFSNLELSFGGFDILWVGIAVYVAWRIPKGFLS